MQTNPAKNRVAVLISAFVAAALIGGIALWSGSRSSAPQVSTDDLSIPGGTDKPASNPNMGDTSGTGSSASPGTSDPTKTPSGSSSMTDKVPQTHTVAANETLYAISRHYYGDHLYAGDIEALNQLDDPNHLAVGMVLKLPKLDDLHKQ